MSSKKKIGKAPNTAEELERMRQYQDALRAASGRWGAIMRPLRLSTGLRYNYGDGPKTCDSECVKEAPGITTCGRYTKDSAGVWISDFSTVDHACIGEVRVIGGKSCICVDQAHKDEVSASGHLWWRRVNVTRFWSCTWRELPADFFVPKPEKTK